MTSVFPFRGRGQRLSIGEARTRTGGERPEAAWAAAGLPVIDEHGDGGSIA